MNHSFTRMPVALVAVAQILSLSSSHSYRAEAQNDTQNSSIRVMLRDRISKRLRSRLGQAAAGAASGETRGQDDSAASALDRDDSGEAASPTSSQSLQESGAEREAEGTAANAEKVTIAGLSVPIWKPSNHGARAPYPTVIFSHGYHGVDTQTKFLMQALARAGYLVIAPNHKDAASGPTSTRAKPSES